MNKPIINVTPLIDVLLVLLIIFMVVAPSKPTAFKAKIPAESKAAAEIAPNPNTLIVTVGNDQTLGLNRQNGIASVADPERLIADLSAEFKKRETEGNVRPGTNEIEKTVFIKAPKKLDYGSVARVVDAVKSSGADPIGLQIDELQ